MQYSESEGGRMSKPKRRPDAYQCMTCGIIFLDGSATCPSCGSKQIHFRIYSKQADKEAREKGEARR